MKSHEGHFLHSLEKNDRFTKYVDGFLSNVECERKESLIIDEADHIFCVRNSDQTKGNIVIKKTNDWFENKLLLIESPP